MEPEMVGLILGGMGIIIVLVRGLYAPLRDQAVGRADRERIVLI